MTRVSSWTLANILSALGGSFSTKIQLKSREKEILGSNLKGRDRISWGARGQMLSQDEQYVGKWVEQL